MKAIDVRGDKVKRFYCSCGLAVNGNGARASHRRTHFKAGDGHRYVTEDEWKRLCAKPVAR